MNEKARSTKLLVRLLILFFWLSVIGLFLLLPNITQRFSSQKSITVLTWPTLIDAQYLDAFEKETGIKVYLRYFESNQELYAKIKESSGKGYDLIMPTDYMVDAMIKEDLLKPIDTSRLEFFGQLYDHLKGNYYDLNNAYSVPYFWSMYGIAIDKDHFKNGLPRPSWGLIFDPKLAQKHTCMIDDAREVILMAAYYLYGPVQSLNDKQLAAIKKLLIEQKQWIEVYTEERANFLLASKVSPVAVMLGAIVARIMRTHSNIDFLIPQEGSFLLIDSFAMPKTTNKQELVYKFLNYIYKKEVLTYYIQKYGYFSPLKNLQVESALPMPTQEQFAKSMFFKNILSSKQLSDIWIALKS